MEPLTDDRPGLHESWRELAEHSLTHDDLPVPAVPAP
jgi:hypothetical protein